MMGFHRSLADMSTFPHPIPAPAAPYSSAKDVGPVRWQGGHTHRVTSHSKYRFHHAGEPMGFMALEDHLPRSGSCKTLEALEGTRCSGPALCGH